MASLDIRLDVDFWDHPKTQKLERAIGFEGVRSLVRLWCWVRKYRPEGRLTDMDHEDIAVAAKWGGDLKEFTQTLIDRKWIDATENGMCIHDWEEHQSWAVKEPERKEKARKAVNARWERCRENAPGKPTEYYENTTGILGRINSCDTPSPLPIPNTKNSLPTEILEFSRTYHEYQHRHNPKIVKGISEKTIEDGAIVVNRLTKKGFDLEKQIKPALRWAAKDEFWKTQVYSLCGLTKKSDNGLTKFQNILAKFETSNGSKSRQSPQQTTVFDSLSEREQAPWLDEAKKQRPELAELDGAIKNIAAKLHCNSKKGTHGPARTQDDTAASN